MSVNKSSKPRVIFVLGGPGSGKGTQCSLLLQKYAYANFIHLSTGALLRQASTGEDTPVNLEIKKLMVKGQMVSSALLVILLKSAIQKSFSVFQKSRFPTTNQQIFVIDGFPRNKQNLESWRDIVRDDFDIKFLLYFQVNEDQIRNRLLIRAKTSGRADDNPETIENRIKFFFDKTIPMLQFYQKNKGITVVINGNESVQRVARDVTILMKKQRLI